MNYLKPHFWYNKRQRNGVLFLVFLSLVVQFFLFFVDFSADEKTNVSDPVLVAFQQEIDSLKRSALKNKVPKIYPFNPNYISDYKGGRLGMSLQEIDRLHAFRKKGLFANSAKEFQQVTRISDSLLESMAPYFKFPAWVVKRQQELARNRYVPVQRKASTRDINSASSQDLITITGVEALLADRIVAYRDKLQGFTTIEQLYEVWDLDAEIAARIARYFNQISTPVIQKTNLNTATFKEVLALPYIDYALCKKLFDYRDEVAELQQIEEVKNIAQFPMEKYARIVLYLEAQ